MKNLLLLFVFFFGIFFTYPQLGPGGVGNTDGQTNLTLWLDAGSIGLNNDDPMTIDWLDLSGYGNNALPGDIAPTYKYDPDANELPALFFDNASDEFMRVLGNSQVRPTSELSVFVVAELQQESDSWASVISTYSEETADDGWAIELQNNTDNMNFWINDFNKTTNVVQPLEWDVNEVWAMTFNLSETEANTYLSEANDSFTLSDAIIYTSGKNDDLLLGAGWNETGPYYFMKGTISEVILYDRAVNDAERIIITNYLSSKYNTSLSSNDFYAHENEGYRFDVAGIGRATGNSNTQTDSQGTGMIRMSNPSNLNNNEYLFWGRNTNTDYSFETNPNNYRARINTQWKLNRLGNLGTVTVSVKDSDLTFNTTDGCNNLKLIVSSSATFETNETYDLVLSGGVYTATGVSFDDNDYFTLEYVDKIVLDDTQFYNGSGTANQPSTNDNCYKLLVKNTATGSLPLSVNANVWELEVESGGVFALNTDKRLSVANAIENNGEIRLVGTSQLLQTHTGTSQVSGSGNLFIDQKAVTTSVYQSGYWSSPVHGAEEMFSINEVLKDGSIPTAAEALTGAATDINFLSDFDGDASTSPIQVSTRWLAKLINNLDFERINHVQNVLTPGEGWNMKSTGSDFTFKGILNDGTYSSSISPNRLSLLGNPYPSALDADQFIADNSSAIAGTLYFYDSTKDDTHYRNAYSGGYATRVIGIGTGFGAGTAPGQYIPVGQAFFVYSEGSTTGEIEFKNSQRDFAILGGDSNFYGKTSSKNNAIKVLRIGFQFEIGSSEVYKRQLALAFRGLTNGYENGFDAYMFDRQPSDAGLKSLIPSSPYVISSIDYFNDEMRIPLEVFLDESRVVSFSLDSIENFSATVFLEDSVEDVYYNLSKDGAATLNLSLGNYTDRFFISFINKSVLNIDSTSTNKDFSVFVDNNLKELKVLLENNGKINALKIFNILGQEILSKDYRSFFEKEISINISGFSSSIYIVQLLTEKGVVTKKIVIK